MKSEEYKICFTNFEGGTKMENCVSINSKQEKIIIKIAGPATHEEAINCLREKLPQLSKMYQ